MFIGGFEKFSMIDYQDHFSAIIFTQGCNFICPYCHNSPLIPLHNKNISFDEQEILNFLKSRKNDLEGVCLTGGEPTIHKDLPLLAKKIKDLGFLLKLDTNGSNFSLLSHMINNNLIDYIAMDYKLPLSKYKKIIAWENKEEIVNNIKESAYFLINEKTNLKYEFRITLLKDFLTFEDVLQIFKELSNSQKVILQNFVSSKDILDKKYLQGKSFEDKEIKILISKAEEFNIKNIFVR